MKKNFLQILFEEENKVEDVIHTQDKAIGSAIIFTLKVISITVGTISTIREWFIERNRPFKKISFKCGPDKKEYSIEGNMSHEQIVNLINESCPELK